MKVKSFEDLTVWQEAHKLTLEVYKLTAKFPGSEKYGVVSQLLRCLQIARGELEETRYFVLLSRDLGYVTSEDCESNAQHCNSIGRLINALGSSLKRRLALGGESPVTNH
jgi:hypothetical protein